MPSAADSIYPGGGNKALGNEDPSQILSTFTGNHEGALVWGTRKQREAYVQLYGYEKALGNINLMLNQNKGLKGAKGDKGDWYNELSDYRDELLSRQGS